MGVNINFGRGCKQLTNDITFLFGQTLIWVLPIYSIVGLILTLISCIGMGRNIRNIRTDNMEMISIPYYVYAIMWTALTIFESVKNKNIVGILTFNVRACMDRHNIKIKLWAIDSRTITGLGCFLSIFPIPVSIYFLSGLGFILGYKSMIGIIMMGPLLISLIPFIVVSSFLTIKNLSYYLHEIFVENDVQYSKITI